MSYHFQIGPSFHACPVVVVGYDPEWVVLFARIRDILVNSLGDLPASIEHVGSTAVPGLAAKPVIDIDFIVQSRNDLRRVIDLLTKIGYLHQGDLGISGREAFESPPSVPPNHLYVVVQGN